MKRTALNSPLLLSLALICLAFALLLAPPCAADTLYVDGNQPSSGSGASWLDPMLTINEALSAANPHDQIWVAMGTYSTSLKLKSEVDLFGGFQGFETELSERHLTTYTVELTTHTTIVNASRAAPGLQRARHAIIIQNTTNIRLDGFAIMGADAKQAKGGGILFRDKNTSITIANCLITANTATQGGGLYLNPSSALKITNTLIAGNTALEDGGGIYIESSQPTPILARLTISGNISRESGAGIAIHNATPIIVNSTIAGNISQSLDNGGGGIFLSNSSPQIINCTIADNEARTLGGGILLAGDSDPYINSCTFNENTQHAIYELLADSDPIVRRCLFYDNPDGDYWDDDTTTRSYTGIAGINRHVLEATENIEGIPQFLMDGYRMTTGTWTLPPELILVDGTTRTLLTSRENAFTTGSLSGLMLTPNESLGIQALITRNTSFTVELMGDLTPFVPLRSPYRLTDYRISYGSLCMDAVRATTVSLLTPTPDGALYTTVTLDLEGDVRPYGFWGDIAYDIGYDIGSDENAGLDSDFLDDPYGDDYSTATIDNDSFLTPYDLSHDEATSLSSILGRGIQRDEDWYRIYVDRDKATLQIHCRFRDLAGDIDIGLYNTEGFPLAFSRSTTDHEDIEIYIPQGYGKQYYFIRVWYGNNANPYDLSWTDGKPGGAPYLYPKAVNPAPAHLAQKQDIVQELTWGNPGKPVGYELYLSTNPSSSAVLFQAHLTEASYTIPGFLDSNTTYYWRVDSIYATTTSLGDTWSFATGSTFNFPARPVNLEPADLTADASLTPLLKASPFIDPNPGDFHYASHFQVRETSTPADYSVPIFNAGPTTASLTTVTVRAGTLSFQATYHWRVRYQDNTGSWSPWSLETAFTTFLRAPFRTINPLPADASIDQAVDTLLNWDSGGLTDSYEVYFGPDPIISQITPLATPANTLYDPGLLTTATTYYWRVDSVNTAGTTQGDLWTFTTGDGNLRPRRPSNILATNPSSNLNLSYTLEATPFSDPNPGDTHQASQWQVREGFGGAAFDNIIIDTGPTATDLTVHTTPSGPLKLATTYSWRVRYQDQHGAWSDWSSPTQFNTPDPPPPAPRPSRVKNFWIWME